MVLRRLRLRRVLPVLRGKAFFYQRHTTGRQDQGRSESGPRDAKEEYEHSIEPKDCGKQSRRKQHSPEEEHHNAPQHPFGLNTKTAPFCLYKIEKTQDKISYSVHFDSLS